MDAESCPRSYVDIYIGREEGEGTKAPVNKHACSDGAAEAQLCTGRPVTKSPCMGVSWGHMTAATSSLHLLVAWCWDLSPANPTGPGAL